MSKHIILIAIYLSFAALPGTADEQTKNPDFNENGTVDFADFLLFAGAFDSKASADLDIFDLINNGVVDHADLLLFVADFGKTIQQSASEEAQLMALSLSGEIQPPQTLEREIEAHLTQIRAQYGNIDTAINSVSYRPPWVPSSIIMRVDTTTYRMIKEGSYRAWDALNLKYQLSKTKIYVSFPLVSLSFDGILHSRHLATLYASLPGVQYVEPDGYAGDSPNIYPLRNFLKETVNHPWGLLLVFGVRRKNMKYFLCILMVCGVFSCGNSPTRPTKIVIEQVFTSGSYDSEGNIFIQDSRIKASHFYTLKLNIIYKGADHRITVASSAVPSIGENNRKAYGLDSVRITLSGGALHITDREKKLLNFGHSLFEGNWSVIYLVISLEEVRIFANIQQGEQL